MTVEQENLKKERPDIRPVPFWGLTIVARAKDAESEDVLQRVKEIWSIVASWGRIWDEEVGEGEGEESSPPTPLETYTNQLPAWIHTTFPEFLNWIPFFFEREWIWWSGAIVNDLVKIDLSVESMPNSTGIFESLIEKCGSEILYNDMWIDAKEIKNIR
jgi:hypothetical protein